jgi:hypothetical protein
VPCVRVGGWTGVDLRWPGWAQARFLYTRERSTAVCCSCDRATRVDEPGRGGEGKVRVGVAMELGLELDQPSTTQVSTCEQPFSLI